MERSGEVANFLSSLLSTFGTDQMGSAFGDAISFEPGTLVIGTDPSEWWDSPDALARAIKAQSEELRGAVATVRASDGFVEDGLGWGAARLDIDFPGAPTASMRVTATLTRRGGGWKIVQCHVSVGVANEDVVGKELTV